MVWGKFKCHGLCSEHQSSNNNIEGEIPFSLGNLSGLRLLHLFGNKLSGNLPSSIGNLSSLEDLALEDNLFNGEIPTELGNLGSLRFLALAKIILMEAFLPVWEIY